MRVPFEVWRFTRTREMAGGEGSPQLEAVPPPPPAPPLPPPPPGVAGQGSGSVVVPGVGVGDGAGAGAVGMSEAAFGSDGWPSLAAGEERESERGGGDRGAAHGGGVTLTHPRPACQAARYGSASTSPQTPFCAQAWYVPPR